MSDSERFENMEATADTCAIYERGRIRGREEAREEVAATAARHDVSQSILEEAQAIVGGARAQDYGSAKESFARIATIASTMTGKTLTPEDCCKVLMAVKLVRQSYKPKRDNLVDLAGYTLILQEIIE